MSIAKEVFGITEFLKKTLINTRMSGFALGLSGGIDSAVCAALAVRAIKQIRETVDGFYDVPNNYKLDLIILPMGNQSADAETAAEVAASLGVDVRTVEMGDTLKAFLSALNPTRDGHTQPDAKTVGNLKARLRMSAIYYSANANGLLVLGTDNRAETYTGYFTKHGDGAADVFPLSDYSKREVYEIGRYLGLPESVLTRAPSAGLWEGQTDEDELGIPYNFIDNVIEGVSSANIIDYGQEKASEFARKLSKQHTATAHKRAAPHTYRRTPEAAPEHYN